MADGELYLLPVVNGEATNLDHVLRDGDRLQLFRLSAGG
jgi:sulfur carrier protein ThiS